MSEFWYPSVDTARRFCDALGLQIRDVGALSSAVARPAQVVWGVEAYVGIHRKGAALLDAVNRSHPLHDGNKRLSWLLVATFYDVNGYDLIVRAIDGDTFIRSVGGDEHLDLEVVADWLERHSAPHPVPPPH